MHLKKNIYVNSGKNVKAVALGLLKERHIPKGLSSLV